MSPPVDRYEPQLSSRHFGHEFLRVSPDPDTGYAVAASEMVVRRNLPSHALIICQQAFIARVRQYHRSCPNSQRAHRELCRMVPIDQHMDRWMLRRAEQSPGKMDAIEPFEINIGKISSEKVGIESKRRTGEEWRC
jgi:hypothetical protein